MTIRKEWNPSAVQSWQINADGFQISAPIPNNVSQARYQAKVLVVIGFCGLIALALLPNN